MLHQLNKMTTSYTYTYTGGMYLTAKKQITKGDLVSLCNDYNSKHGSDGMKFQPEPITEGGIVYKFPDNSPHGEYKSIRMNFEEPFIKRNKTFIPFESILGINAWNVSKKHLKKLGVLHLLEQKTVSEWPPVLPNVMESWENNNDVILECGLSIKTYLKAFHGAPVFTENELKIFGERLEKIGLNVDSKYPTDKELISEGRLGNREY